MSRTLKERQRACGCEQCLKALVAGVTMTSGGMPNASPPSWTQSKPSTVSISSGMARDLSELPAKIETVGQLVDELLKLNRELPVRFYAYESGVSVKIGEIYPDSSWVIIEQRQLGSK